MREDRGCPTTPSSLTYFAIVAAAAKAERERAS